MPNKNIIPINKCTRQTQQSHEYYHDTFIREFPLHTQTHVHTYNTDIHTRVHAQYMSLEAH